MDIINFPIIIDFSFGKIFGILRGINSIKDKIVICCPATTGTRIGPQRIFVEIAQKLTEHRITSFCVDIPPLGDSFDTGENNFQGVTSEKLIQHYSKYLEIIINYLKRHYDFKEFILLTISDGGLPVYNYARNNKEIQRIILLSPNHRLDNTQQFNKKNLKQYYNKLLKQETWIKLFTLRLNTRKIIQNVYRKRTVRKKTTQTKEFKTHNVLKKILVVFGEKEQMLNECIDFWNQEQNKGYFEDYSYKIIDGADHSFFGWKFKRDVETCIIDWFVN